MIVVLPLMIYVYNRNKSNNKAKRTISILNIFPMFVLGFILFAAIRSIGDYIFIEKALFWKVESWNHLWIIVKNWSGNLLAVAMAGVGLNTDFKKFRKLGFKPFLIGLVAALFVGIISFTLITLFRFLKI